jgi:hypothetical protein
MKADPTLFPILADHTLGLPESLTLGIAGLHLYDLAMTSSMLIDRADRVRRSGQTGSVEFPSG